MDVEEVPDPVGERNAAALIFAHNHPTGDARPSPEDISLTGTLIRAAAALEIHVLDHIIIGREGYYSLAEHGHIKRLRREAGLSEKVL